MRSVTTKGMGETEMTTIAGFIERAIASKDDEEALAKIKAEVRELCESFPFYADRL